jgi:hypothetical protein
LASGTSVTTAQSIELENSLQENAPKLTFVLLAHSNQTALCSEGRSIAGPNDLYLLEA